jgi:hypothetical protein
VEGHETRVEQDTQMDVDNGHNGASGSGRGGGGKKGETDGENKYENQKEKKDNEGSDQPNHLSYGAKQTDSLQEVQPTVENDNKGTHSQGRS